MKPASIFLVALFTASICFGQQKITVPAVMTVDISFELPELPPQTNDASVVIITNVYYINTNIYTTVNITTNITVVGTNASQGIVILSNNIIDPSLGTRLLRNFSSPTTFTFGSFSPQNSYTTFYWRNPTRQRITWPPGVLWLNGTPPTNQIRGAVLFEQVLGNEVWATH